MCAPALALAIGATSALALAPAAEAATGWRTVGTARIQVGPNPAIDGMSAYVEHSGTNPEGPDTSPTSNPIHEPYAPTDRWNELHRWQDWAGYDTTTAMGFPVNKDATWERMRKSANNLIRAWKGMPKRKDGKARHMILSLPLNTSEGSTLRDVAAGLYDSYYESVRDTLIANNFKQTVIRLGWEAQGFYDWSVQNPETPEGKGMDAVDYIAAYRHVHDVFMSASGAQFEWGFDTQQWGFKAGKGQLLYPGDAYVDYIGVTFYDAGVNNTGTAEYFRRQNQPNLDAMADFAKERNKAIYIPEFGATSTANQKREGRTQGDNANFIELSLRWINSHDVAFYHYWHRWDVSRLGPYKLTPVYSTMPSWDGKQATGFTRQPVPKTLMPRAAAAWHATIDEIAGRPTPAQSPAPTTTAPPAEPAPEPEPQPEPAPSKPAPKPAPTTTVAPQPEPEPAKTAAARTDDEKATEPAAATNDDAPKQTVGAESDDEPSIEATGNDRGLVLGDAPTNTTDDDDPADATEEPSTEMAVGPVDTTSAPRPGTPLLVLAMLACLSTFAGGVAVRRRIG